MPKPKKRKDAKFNNTPMKSVFLYGRPNKEKADSLAAMQGRFTALVNGHISLLGSHPEFTLQLVKNDKHDPDIRALEKANRAKGANSAFSQNAFDMAVTLLSNRLDSIRLDMIGACGIFAKSKVLFAMSVMGKDKAEMEGAMRELAASAKAGSTFHTECADLVHSMTAFDFITAMREFDNLFAMLSLEYRVPYVKKTPVPIDSRLGRIAESSGTTYPYAVSVSRMDGGPWMDIPVDTSSDALRRIRQYKMAGTFSYSIDDGLIKVMWAYSRHVEKPAVSEVLGVDTGITDCFHTSDGRAIGSFADMTGFYKDVVEPAFAYLSSLRNKKRGILHYVRNHKKLPPKVRRSLLDKVDRLEHMIQTCNAPYRKKRHYHQMLDHEIAQAVSSYISSITKDTLTAIERLDLKEFNKSRRLNGELSVFARGKLQQKLMSELNWRGYDFIEVEPAYTSQACPVCGNLDKDSRNGKNFTCTYCGHHDDADHVGAVNIRERAMDDELMKLCTDNAHNKKQLMEALQKYYSARHEQYMKDHPHTGETELPHSA